MNPSPSQVEFSLDPIIYFYTHSLLIILVSAVVFMTLGMWIGWLTWARYRRRARAYQEECDLLRHEIAALKRRIGEETVGPAPLVLINEDAPVPEPVDNGPILPGFDASEVVSKPAAAAPKPVPEAPVEEVVEEWHPSETKPASKEGLAAAVLGTNGTALHKLEPLAPPDSITELAAPPAVVEPPATPPPVIPPEPVPARALVEIGDPIQERHSHTLNGSNGVQAPPAKVEEEPKAPDLDAGMAFAEELALGVAVQDPKLGILLRFQPERWDDLTLLRGVGENLQQRLHDHGVHTFKQIAYWTEGNVEEFASKIEAKDRIRREHWVTQARDMHFLKYGEKLG